MRFHAPRYINPRILENPLELIYHFHLCFVKKNRRGKGEGRGRGKWLPNRTFVFYNHIANICGSILLAISIPVPLRIPLSLSIISTSVSSRRTLFWINRICYITKRCAFRCLKQNLFVGLKEGREGYGLCFQMFKTEPIFWLKHQRFAT